MLRLNDDCLFEIFRRLPLKQQLTLTSVCARFRDIVTLVWGRTFREMHTMRSELTKMLTREEYETLFALIAADHLEKLTINDSRHYAFTSYLGRYNYRPEFSFYLSVDYPRVLELDIQESSMHDGYMRLVARRFPALQVLHVSSVHVTGAYICEMRQLRELYMPECTLDSEHLNTILDGRLQLTHLDISSKNDRMSFRKIGHIIAAKLGSLPLRQLVISEDMFDAMFLQQLSGMRDLRTLCVVNPFHRDFTSFYHFFGANIVELHFSAVCDGLLDFPISSNDARHLSSLRAVHLDHYTPNSLYKILKAVNSLRAIYFSKSTLSSELAEFVASCPHLEYIRLKTMPSRYEHTNLGWFEQVFLRWLEKLYARLEASKATRSQPLTVYAYGFDLTRLMNRQQNLVKYKTISAAAAEAVPEESIIPKSYIVCRFSEGGLSANVKEADFKAAIEAFRPKNCTLKNDFLSRRRSR